MTLRIFVTVLLVLIAGTIAAQDASPETCRLVFDREASRGHYVATVPTEHSRSELMSRDLGRLSATHELGRVVTGSVDLSSSSLDTEGVAQGGAFIGGESFFRNRSTFRLRYLHSFLESCRAKLADQNGLPSATCNQADSNW